MGVWYARPRNPKPKGMSRSRIAFAIFDKEPYDQDNHQDPRNDLCDPLDYLGVPPDRYALISDVRKP